MKYGVYIWGAGHLYNEFRPYLYNNKETMEVRGIITTNRGYYRYIDGYKCMTPDEADWKGVDYCIVAVEDWSDIKKYLLQNGMDGKIIQSHSFKIPGFDIEIFEKLQSQKPTIFCNYCLGGWLYREFGLPMLSPTINMYCSGMQYIKFLKKYEYYLNFEMKKYDEPYSNHTDGTMGKEDFYPHGIVGDEDDNIVWVLNHYYPKGDSVLKYNIRRKRVNYQNIVALMICQSDQEAYDFDKLNIEKKVGFYYKDLGLDNVVYIPEWMDWKNIFEYDSEWGSYVNQYMRNFVKGPPSIDWIKFLLGEKKYVCKCI